MAFVVAKSLKRYKISRERNLLKDSESEETSEDIQTEVPLGKQRCNCCVYLTNF